MLINGDSECLIVDKSQQVSILKVRVTQILVAQDRYHPGYQLEHNGYRFDRENESIEQAGVADGAVITIHQGVDPDASQTASDAEEHEDAESQGRMRQDKYAHNGSRQQEEAEQGKNGAWPHNVPTEGTEERWTFMMVYEDGAIDMVFDQGTQGLHILRTVAEAKQVKDWRRASMRHARTGQCMLEDTNLEEFGAQQKDVFNVEIMVEGSWESQGTESGAKPPLEHSQHQGSTGQAWPATHIPSEEPTQEAGFRARLPIHLGGQHKPGDFIQVDVPRHNALEAVQVAVRAAMRTRGWPEMDILLTN